MTQRLEFFFDFVSPYSYLAHSQLPALGVEVTLRPMTVLKGGVLMWPPPPPQAAATAPKAMSSAGPSTSATADKSVTTSGAAKATPYVPSQPTSQTSQAPRKSHGHGAPVGAPSASTWWLLLGAGAALFGVGVGAPPTFLTHLTVFVLACFIGYQVVWSVTPALHTPLMSVTNAISGIIVIGGMLQIGGDLASPATVLGIAAVFLATLNIFGGFLVTHRMLKMFRR